jgi:hypothetical protein
MDKRKNTLSSHCVNAEIGLDVLPWRTPKGRVNPPKNPRIRKLADW